MFIKGKFYDVRVVALIVLSVAFILNGWLACFIPRGFESATFCQGMVIFVAAIACVMSFIFVGLKTEP
jgi:hypothetical protein